MAGPTEPWALTSRAATGVTCFSANRQRLRFTAFPPQAVSSQELHDGCQCQPLIPWQTLSPSVRTLRLYLGVPHVGGAKEEGRSHREDRRGRAGGPERRSRGHADECDQVGNTWDDRQAGAELRKLKGLVAHVVLEDASTVWEASQGPSERDSGVLKHFLSSLRTLGEIPAGQTRILGCDIKMNPRRGRLTWSNNEDQGWEPFHLFIPWILNKHLGCARALGDAGTSGIPPLPCLADVTQGPGHPLPLSLQGAASNRPELTEELTFICYPWWDQIYE